MLFSVIVPTFNRAKSLERCLKSLGAQEGPPKFEAIVIDDASTDGTAEMLAGYEAGFPLKLVRVARNGGPAAARNRGLSAAEGDYVLFLDDDVVAVPSLLARHAKAHQGANGLVVIGPMRAPQNARMSSWVRWESYELEKQYAAMAERRFDPTPRQFYTANVSVATESLRAVGGFDVTFRRAEDVELGYRLSGLGLRFVYQPDALVLHDPDRGLIAWWRIPHQYGVADVRMWRRKGQTHIPKVISREFQTRNRIVRAAVRSFSPGRLKSRGAAGALVAVGAAFGGAGLFTISRRAFSLAYNILYFTGINEELASPARFREIVRSGDDSTPHSELSSA